MNQVHPDDLVHCGKCDKIIEPKLKAVALDDAEYYHVECAAKMLHYRCKDCGYMYSQKPEDMICDALDGCGGNVVFIRSAKKVFNIVKKWAESPYC